MSNIEELHIIDGNNNLFNGKDKYIIPLYQRAYAWEDKQITQLIEDINDVSEDENYYIGSLIVAKREAGYEVVDGQQRLTSLYLLLNCLKTFKTEYEQLPQLNVEHTLTFDCRKKSNDTLEKISKLPQENGNNLDMGQIEEGIQSGINILNELIAQKDFDRDAFIKKLERVILYRIEMPEHTDLNRYFEVMNTRGEQLEQNDILKATLMGNLPEKEQSVFAKIWEACADMTGYVQMHVTKEVREKIFNAQWDGLPPKDWDYYVKEIGTDGERGAGHTIAEIIDGAVDVDDSDGDLDDETRVRFESIIDFPYFLLHTLKVLINTQEYDKSTISEVHMDDKKLNDSFDEVIKDVCGSDEKGGQYSKADFSRDFVMCLLRTRYLFDKYIVKREYTYEDLDGKWSLKSLRSDGKEKAQPYYKDTDFGEPTTQKNIMIQSALRVSYTSPRGMHWITRLLTWLSEDDCKHTSDNDIVNYSDEAEKVAIAAVKANFLNPCADDGKYAMGVGTPHIVFNYLDYLLWLDDQKSSDKKYSDFTFGFRTSVEHWYPQNPSEGTFGKWEDGVDQFGNLCIVQRRVNSKFSNMSPEAKKITFEDTISNGSLKLRKMSELTEAQGDMGASLYWKETACKEHEDEMIERLKEACGLGDVES
ncbi:DUF262 domain-containing protein [Alloscardovia omnicolens]|uniref:DUF262 domain-containing protein n=1 Tax=Alloscardovia omnicolens TaxID=419015 RepID=UPI003A75531A